MEQGTSNTDIRSLFMTIPEAAAVLGISRNSAYAAAKQFRRSGGSEGLPNLKVGGSLRVPEEALRRMAQLDFPGLVG